MFFQLLLPCSEFPTRGETLICSILTEEALWGPFSDAMRPEEWSPQDFCMGIPCFWRTTQKLKSRVCTVSCLLLSLVLGSQVYKLVGSRRLPPELLSLQSYVPQTRVDLILSQAILLTSNSHLQPIKTQICEAEQPSIFSLSSA